MYIVISNQQEFLESVKEESLKIGNECLKLSLKLFIYLKENLIHFLRSYGEYSLLNIREVGLGEIFFQRALRFFTLEIESSPRKERKRTKRKYKRTPKAKVVHALKVIVFPLYFLILLLQGIAKGKIKKKMVRNVYVE